MICRLKVRLLDGFCCNKLKHRKNNIMLKVDNCLLSLNNVEKVNKNAYDDELQLIVSMLSVLYNILEVN